ncbi:hypothetical protein BPOR_0347g00070 [Botrytis porri]|uniref:Uncharacterized protein n=1 Tax=Botrytis porri TaxID=87229 RepID=A0A4Z1KSL5_9HELO|nr:hypothetical protein BPOR_0347g00070 [Botrytis porri]
MPFLLSPALRSFFRIQFAAHTYGMAWFGLEGRSAYVQTFWCLLTDTIGVKIFVLADPKDFDRRLRGSRPGE